MTRTIEVKPTSSTKIEYWQFLDGEADLTEFRSYRTTWRERCLMGISERALEMKAAATEAD